MPDWVIEFVVHADDDIQCSSILDWRCDDHPLYATVEIRLKLLRPEKLACALKDDVAAEISPRDLSGTFLFAKADASFVDKDGFLSIDAYRFIPSAVNA